MKILCLNYEYPPIGGGGASAARGLAEAMVHDGHQIDCVTSGFGDLPAFEQLGGVDLHRVKCRRTHAHYVGSMELATQVLPSYRKALALDNAQRYDLNHTHFIFPSGLTSYLLWRRTGLPYVITAHGSDVPGYNPDRFMLPHKLLHPLWRRIISNAELVISPSKFLKSLILSHCDVPVEVIANGADLPTLDAPVAKRNQILLVSRMFERKGVQYFLSALEGLSTDWDILVAGDGPFLETLKTQALQLPHKIKFLGFVPRDELELIYRASKIFVFPSVQENYPMVLLEAMNAGCAIITSKADGCAEVVADAGITTAVRSPEEIRVALERLLASEEERTRLGHIARERVKQFTWEKIARQYGHCLQTVIDEVPAGERAFNL